MEKIQKLKEEAYKIATETYSSGYGEHYRWSVDVRISAMEAYARLVVAENSTKQN